MEGKKINIFHATPATPSASIFLTQPVQSNSFQPRTMNGRMNGRWWCPPLPLQTIRLHQIYTLKLRWALQGHCAVAWFLSLVRLVVEYNPSCCNVVNVISFISKKITSKKNHSPPTPQTASTQIGVVRRMRRGIIFEFSVVACWVVLQQPYRCISVGSKNSVSMDKSTSCDCLSPSLQTTCIRTGVARGMWRDFILILCGQPCRGVSFGGKNSVSTDKTTWRCSLPGGKGKWFVLCFLLAFRLFLF